MPHSNDDDDSSTFLKAEVKIPLKRKKVKAWHLICGALLVGVTIGGVFI